MLKLKFLLFLPILFLFLPSFVLWIPGLNTIFYVSFLTIYLAIIVVFIKDYKYFINKVKSFAKKTPLKIFLFVLALIIIDSILLSILGITSINTTIKNVFFQIILRILPLLLYFIIIIDKYISYKNFVKLFMFLLWSYLCLGIVIYFSQLCNIQIIINVTDFLSNARYVRAFHSGSLDYFPETSNYYAFGLPRLDNLHEEPSLYARFLLIFLPMVYSFNLSKIKLFENKYVNFFIKKTYIPLIIVNILMTMSPIFFIFFIIITLIYFYKDILLFIKKYFLLLLSFMSILGISICNINFTNTFFSRIINVLTQVKNFNDFILIEESLAIRIVNYVNTICSFFKFPITGVGIGNLKYYLLEQYQKSPLPLPPRIETRIELANNTNLPVLFDCSLLYVFLAECGIIITIIYLYFLITVYRQIFKLQKLISQKNKNFYYLNLKGIKYSIISIFILMFYDSSLLTIEFYVVIIMALLILYKYKRGDLC